MPDIVVVCCGVMGFGCAVTVSLAICCGAVDDGAVDGVFGDELADTGALEDGEAGEELGEVREDEGDDVTPFVCTVPDTV